MGYSTKEDLLRRREAIPCQDIELPEGGKLKVGPLLPEVRARFPQKNSWEKLLLTLHFGILTPQLSLRESAEFVNLFPLRAIAVGRKILQLSAADAFSITKLFHKTLAFFISFYHQGNSFAVDQFKLFRIRSKGYG